ncbi:MAG: PilZ domain-containing protein [Sphingomicrobium sp.]
MAAVQSERRRAPRDDDPERRGRRADPRAYILFAGLVEALNGHVPITLLDVSRKGARLEGERLPPVGKEIILRCGGIDTFGTIAWAAGDRRGMQFDEPISASELVALRDIAVAAEQSGMSPDEQQAAADWRNGFAR